MPACMEHTGASAPLSGNNLLLATPVTSTSSTNTVHGGYLLNARFSANTDYTFGLYVYGSGGRGAICNVPANSVTFAVLGQ